MTNRGWWLAILLAFGSSGDPGSILQIQAAAAQSQIEFFVVDRFGNGISQAEIALEDENTHVVRNIVLPSAPIEIPSGGYLVRARARGYERCEFRLQVDGPRVFVPIELAIGTIIPAKPSSTLLVRVNSGPGSGLVSWAKLIELYSGKSVDGRVGRDGNIHFIGLQPGRYLCLLFDGGELRSTQALTLRDGANTTTLK